MATVPAAAGNVAAPFERCVFVNCPFDDEYLPLLHAMVFTIHDCGFVARLAVEDTGGREMRIDKITRIVEQSCYSIHDISRVEVSGPSPLPRFNMPFEAGLALGACRFAATRTYPRDFLLLDGEPYRDKKTLSDLAGQDARYHHNDPGQLVSAVRRFLAAKARLANRERMRGAAAIWARFEEFRSALPRLCILLELTQVEIEGFDYIPEWTRAVTDWQRRPS